MEYQCGQVPHILQVKKNPNASPMTKSTTRCVPGLEGAMSTHSHPPNSVARAKMPVLIQRREQRRDPAVHVLRGKEMGQDGIAAEHNPIDHDVTENDRRDRPKQLHVAPPAAMHCLGEISKDIARGQSLRGKMARL